MVNRIDLLIRAVVNNVCVGRFVEVFRKRMVVRVFISRMLAYSARKNSVNSPALYSTLNPDTSSDSPSVRSNGARFVSASVEVYHIISRGHVVSAK